MEKLFQLKANGTTVRTELLAGLTTFMTMAYIIALNPNLLTNFAVGTPLWNGVFLAPCIASTFLFRIGGEEIRCTLRRIEGYDPSAASTRCTFTRLPNG